MHSSSTSGSRLCLDSLFSSLPLKVVLFSTILFPLHNISANKTHQFNHVVDSSTLTVVATETPTTVFKDGDFLHGFGYDLARQYASSLNVKLDFKTVKDDATALRMVSDGKANFAMTTANFKAIENRQLISFSASCGDTAALSKNGLNTELNWVFKSAEDPLAQTASGFTCQSKQSGVTDQLASFYNRNVVEPESWDIIQKDLNNRLPIYKASFKKSANQYDLDWQLLAAIGYQESYLKPNSISPTGVRGLMMLTNNTARAMGVTNRVDPKQSIQGGAKYYDQMLSQYQNIPYPDRNWYALVAYNMGPGAVSQIQSRLSAQGKNPNNWIEFYDYLNTHKASNSRYRQAVQYVTRIRSYVEHIKTNERLVDI